jgi:L-histidine N-alpha-methyltransferase
VHDRFRAGRLVISRTPRLVDPVRTMAEDVRASLCRRPVPELPSKYFYDARGSALFDAITQLPEYYPTRVETAILAANAAAIVDDLAPRELVELGSGAGLKTRLFLDAMQARAALQGAVLLEISEPYLRRSLAELRGAYPGARLRGVVGDFEHDLASLGHCDGRRLALFLAGTIGNLHPDALPRFFREAARVLAPGDGFLVGVDLVKDPARLHAAYNDAAGVTAEFNRNILRVVNDRLGADFDPDAFEHRAFYDRDRAWVEMRLRATRAMQVAVPLAGVSLSLAEGDEIRTELSCKYTRESFAPRLTGSGFVVERWLTDDERLFATALLRRT